MKVIKNSTVYLIGAQYTEASELNQFLEDHKIQGWRSLGANSSAERIIEIGGRLCYMAFDKPRPGGNPAYIKHLKEVGHGSCLEHAVFTVIAVGISRSLSHEWVRHRAGMSPSQLSQRYVSEERGEFVIPPEIQGDPWLEDTWAKSCAASWESYKLMVVHLADKIGRRKEYVCTSCRGSGRYLVDGREEECARCDGKLIDPECRTEIRKAARGAARSVLPNATETKIQMTGNARAWRHFFELRANPAADVEIRNLAVAIWRKLAANSPNIFGDYTEEQTADGTIALTTPYRKV